MLAKALSIILLLVFLTFASAHAADRFGIYGMQGFTSEDVLPSPTGFGVFLQRDLSAQTLLRISYSWAKDTDRFTSTVPSREGGPLLPGDTIRDSWQQEASIQTIELSLLMRTLGGSAFSFSLGPGIGFAKFNREVTGDTTGFVWGGDSSFRLSFSALAEVAFAHRRLDPLIVHLVVRERITIASQENCVDCARPFEDSVTSAELALALSYPL